VSGFYSEHVEIMLAEGNAALRLKWADYRSAAMALATEMDRAEDERMTGAQHREAQARIDELSGAAGQAAGAFFNAANRAGAPVCAWSLRRAFDAAKGA
jgi:hypothetical protein